MENKLTGIVIDTRNNTCKMEFIEDSMDSFKEIIGSNNLEFDYIEIDGIQFLFIADPNGMTCTGNKVSCTDVYGNPILCGNVIIFTYYSDGKVMDLSPSEMRYIMSRIGITTDGKEEWFFVTGNYVGNINDMVES